MTEAWLTLGGENSAARMLFKRVGGGAGVGLAQLQVTVELSSRKAIADNKSLWLNGTASVRNLGRASGHLGTLRTYIQPEKLPERGGTRDITFTADISYAQLQVIEEHRTGPVTLAFDFSGYWLVDGSPDAFWSVQLEHEVKQGEWVVLLEQMQYRRILLVELDAPDAERSPAQAAAVEYFADAQRHYLAQDWRLTVESLRQSLAALVGKRPDEEDDEADVQASLKDVRKASNSRRVGYHERYAVVRQALKFTCDLGAHPEAAETTKQDAYATLLMTGGLLQGLIHG